MTAPTPAGRARGRFGQWLGTYRITAFATVALAAALALGLVAWRYQTVVRENEALVARRATERANVFAGLLGDSIAATLRQAAALHDIAGLLTEARLTGDAATEARLQALLDPANGIAGPDVVQVAAMGADGRSLWSSFNWAMPTIDLSDRDHFTAFLRDPTLRTYFSAPVTGRGTGEQTIQYARAVRDAARQLRAVTVVSLRTNMLARLCGEIDLAEDDSVLLVRDDGTVLMRRYPGRPVGIMLPAAPHANAMQGGTLMAGASPLDQVTRYVATRRIPGRYMTLHVGISRASQMQAMEGVTASLWQETLYLDIAIVVSALGAALAILLIQRAGIAAARAAALAGREAWFRSVIDEMADGVLVLENPSADGGTVAYANRRAGEIFVVAPAALVGRLSRTFTAPEEEARIAPLRERLVRGGSVMETVYRAMRPDGSRFWMAAGAMSVAEQDGSGNRRVIMTLRDVTAAQESTQALAEARARIDRMLQVIPGVFYQLHRAGDGTVRVDFVSDSVAALFGVPVETAMRPGFLLEHAEGDIATLRLAALQQAGPGGIATVEFGVRIGERRYWVRDVLRATSLDEGTLDVGGFLYDASAEHVAETARRAAEEEARRMNWALNAHSRALEVLLHGGSLRDMMQRVCEGIIDTTQYVLACVAIPEHGADKAVRIVASAGPGRSYVEGLSITWDATRPEGDGPTGRAIRSGRPEVINDIVTDARFAAWRERAAAFGIRSSVTTPCVVGGEVVGAVLVYGGETDMFQPAVLAVFERLAEEIGLAIGIETDRGRLRAAEERLSDAARLGPGLLYRARLQGEMVEIVDVVGESARILGEIAGRDGGPAALAEVIGAKEPVAAMRALADDAASSADFACPGLGGATRWVRNSVRVTRRQGEMLEVVGYLSDVTQEKQNELRRQHLTTLVTLGEMATGLAHELNQPLTTISFTAQNAGLLLARTPPEVAQAAERVGRIMGQVERAAKLIDHMRIFARNEHAPAHPLGWRVALDRALELMQSKLMGCEVRCALPEDLPDVMGAPIPMEMVLINLISNAVDAYGEGQARVVDISATVRDGQVVLRVKDQAGGIPPAALPRLFEPFFTTKPPGKGTGLGLSLVFGAVMELGGTITAANAEGGAVFEVILPAA